MPTTDIARSRLSQALRTAKAERKPFIRVIHGYGSSGSGGAIKADTHRFLTQKKREGFIKDFIKGEDFTPYRAAAQSLVQKYPLLKKESDYGRQNDGITIVIF